MNQGDMIFNSVGRLAERKVALLQKIKQISIETTGGFILWVLTQSGERILIETDYDEVLYGGIKSGQFIRVNKSKIALCVGLGCRDFLSARKILWFLVEGREWISHWGSEKIPDQSFIKEILYLN